MNKTIKIKRGLKANLPVLADGELAYCIDTKELYIGTADGINVKQGADIEEIEELVSEKADKLVLTNLVSNGDLLIDSNSDNIPDGFIQSSSNINQSLINGVFTFTPTSELGGFIKTNNNTSVAGHKYYYFAYVKASSPMVRLITYSPIVYQYHDANGSWQLLSFVTTKDGTNDSMRIETGHDSVFAEIQVDYLGAINLTATFGAGNEPTKEQMDEIIRLKGFFQQTTIDLKDLMILGFTQETRMTPTLTNATTTYLTYRKDDLGYVDIAGNLTITTFGTNFTLPEGYRPLTTLRIPVVSSTGTFGYVIINTNGTIVSNANATIFINTRFATI